MSASGFVKAGWFLVGLGVGAFGATMLMKRELEKPIGEIEEYIPLEDREGFEDFEDSSEDGSDRDSDSRVRSKNSEDSQKDISTRGSKRERIERGHSRKELESGRHNDREEKHTEFSSNKDEVLNYYRSSSKNATRSQGGSEEDQRRREFKERRGEATERGTRYSRMYQDEDIEEALHVENSHRRSRNSYEPIEDHDPYSEDDSPSDDDYVVSPVYDSDLHDEFTLERVEENIEIFLDDNPQDFITMIFYEGDNTLCDDGEQIVPNADEVIGLAALSRLIEGGPGAENGVIFVHNLKTSLNYEVVLDAGSYQDTVIGQFESHLNEDGGRSGYS